MRPKLEVKLVRSGYWSATSSHDECAATLNELKETVTRYSSINTPITLGLTLVAVGMLSLNSASYAVETIERDASKGTIGDTFSPDVKVSLHVPLQSTDNLSLGAVTESSQGEESASELNRKLTNPVSDIWSISNQFNNFELNNGQWNNNWNFKPVMPVSLTNDWNLITRPVMPFYNIVPHETAPGEFARTPGWVI